MLNSSCLTASQTASWISSHYFSSRTRNARKAEARAGDREEKAAAGSPALNPRYVLLAILLFAAFLRFFETPHRATGQFKWMRR